MFKPGDKVICTKTAHGISWDIYGKIVRKYDAYKNNWLVEIVSGLTHKRINITVVERQLRKAE